MRPNSPYQKLLVEKLFKGHDVRVYAVPKGILKPCYNHQRLTHQHPGTHLPENLLLVHERTDHYSLQPAQDMTLDRKFTKSFQV